MVLDKISSFESFDTKSSHVFSNESILMDSSSKSISVSSSSSSCTLGSTTFRHLDSYSCDSLRGEVESDLDDDDVEVAGFFLHTTYFEPAILNL